MKILAIDSTALTASVALTEDTKLIGLYTLHIAHTHSETLLPMIENLCQNAKQTIHEIDLFSCSVGPGSFTGVRIGVSLLKGLAFGTEKPCVGVSTLEMLAQNLAGWKGILCPVMDARRNQVYTALFESDGTTITRLQEDRLLVIPELQQELEKFTCPIFFTGDGYALASETILLLNVQMTPEFLRYPNAYQVARCAYQKYNNNTDSFSSQELAPVYLRASQAERERLERLHIQ